MDSNADLPLTSLPSIAITTVTFIVLWTILSSYVAKRGGFSWAESLLETHHFVAATLSLTLAAYVADIGHNIIDRKTGYSIDPSVLGYLYQLLKIYEYLDILLAVAIGKSKVNKYTAFSHIFLPIWSYFRIIARPGINTDWRFQVIGECLSRFASRAIPWLVEDLQTEQSLLSLAEEGRWYPDLAITAFWALFTFQGQRDSEQGIKSFGEPYPEEPTARVLSVAILLYASFAKRQEDERKKKLAKPQTTIQTKTDDAPSSRAAHASGLRQPSRKTR